MTAMTGAAGLSQLSRGMVVAMLSLWGDTVTTSLRGGPGNSTDGGAVPVLEEVGRQALEGVDETLLQIQRSVEDAARSGAIDRDLLERLEKTSREAAARANENLPREIDAQATDEIRRRLLGIVTRDFSDASSLDVADHILVEMEAVRHIIRDLLQEQPPVELRDASQLIALLESWVPGISVNSLAELLGCSPRQLQRLRHDSRSATPRAQLVAKLIAILRHAWTDQGVLSWFRRPRLDLDGRAPVELLDDPANERELIGAARAGRVQGGV